MKEQIKASIFKALARPTRMKIVEMLKKGERCVCEMLSLLEIEQPNISQHLAILRNQRSCLGGKKGLFIFY